MIYTFFMKKFQKDKAPFSDDDGREKVSGFIWTK